MTYTQLLFALEHKLDLAQMMDYEFDMEDYEWILGREIVCALERELDTYCRYSTEDDSMYIFGIPVTLDYKNKWRMSLVKEIK